MQSYWTINLGSAPTTVRYDMIVRRLNMPCIERSDYSRCVSVVRLLKSRIGYVHSVKNWYTLQDLRTHCSEVRTQPRIRASFYTYGPRKLFDQGIRSVPRMSPITSREPQHLRSRVSMNSLESVRCFPIWMHPGKYQGDA